MFERAAVTAVFTIALVSSTVPGSGKTYSKSDPLASARDGSTVYEHQVASSRTVRVWGDTAAVTALLWLKGTTAGKPFEYRLWYSDTYVRLASGWRYVFGQASLPLPDAQQPK
jgi:endonuclease YncB( thermonuclease family)